MCAFTSRRWLALFMILALIILLIVATAEAKEKHKIAGKMTMAQTIREAVEIGDTKDHIMTLSQYEGTNESAGEHVFMDGAQVVNTAFGDFVQGNGPQRGHVKLMLGDAAVFCQWEGMVTTIVPEEGSPIMAFEGTYSYTKGTGQFENIQGSGSYKGAFTSKTEYAVEWEGEYSIAE